MWDVWRLDPPTWGWIVWLTAFVALETWTLAARQGQELTTHLRPVFLSHPLVWYVTLAAAVWAVVHLWFPAWESRLLDLVRGG